MPLPSELTDRTAGSLLSPEVSEEIALGDIFHFVMVRWVWIALGAGLGLVLAVVFTIASPRRYTATATVELNKDSTSGLGIQDLSGSASSILSGTQYQTELLTHQNVLLNANTALSVINDLNLMSQPPYSEIPEGKYHDRFLQERGLPLVLAPLTRDRAIKIFSGGLKVAIVKNTTLLTVSYTDTDPDRSSRIANAVVQAYLKNHTESRYDATSSASKWLTNQLEGLKRKVEDSHRKVAAFEQSTGVIATNSQGAISGKNGAASYTSIQDPNSTPVQRLMALNAAFSKAQIARIETEAAYQLANTYNADVIIQASATSLADSMENPGLAIGAKNIQLLDALRSEASRLKIELANAESKFGPRFPEVLSIQTQLASVNEQIRQELIRINEQAKADFQLAKANEDALQKSLDAQQQAVFALGNSLTGLTFLEQEENTSRQLYQDLYTRLEEANIAAGVKSTDMVVVDAALKPSLPSSPVLTLNLILGLAIGTFLGLLVGLFFHLRDTALRSPEDFEAVWKAPLLGIVPRFDLSKAWRQRKRAVDEEASKQDTVAGRSPLLNSPRSKIAEAYRQIRTAILLSNIDSPPQVILFTSGLSGDGKSTSAYNLAVAFALQSSRVLLLDADLRRPTLREKTGCLAKVGLSDLLKNDALLEEALQKHPQISSLSVLTAGTIPPMPAELLGSHRFASLIQRLRGDFDYILIDAPPALLVTDPLLIASNVDGIVVVVRSGVTSKYVVKSLASSLSRLNVRVLGYVVNGMDYRKHSYNHGYGYGYGYGYDYKAEGSYYDDLPKYEDVSEDKR